MTTSIFQLTWKTEFKQNTWNSEGYLFKVNTGTQHPFFLMRGCREHGEEGEGEPMAAWARLRSRLSHGQMWQTAAAQWGDSIPMLKARKGPQSSPNQLQPTQAPKSNQHWKLWLSLLSITCWWLPPSVTSIPLAPAKALVYQWAEWGLRLAGKDRHHLCVSKHWEEVWGKGEEGIWYQRGLSAGTQHPPHQL